MKPLYESSLDFRRLKRMVSIDRVLRHYGLMENLLRRGATVRGRCPLHGGDNPTAFRVHLEKNVWMCFTHCGGGDTVELIRRIEGCSHGEAARRMRSLALLPGERGEWEGPVASREEEPFRPFVRRLPLDPQVPFLQEEKGITMKTAALFEAGASERSTFLRGMVGIRLHDLRGMPLGYAGRRLESERISLLGKWRYPRGFPKKEVLFNAHRARPHRSLGVVVVECPWATLRVHQAGIPSVVGLLGTRLWGAQEEWLRSAPTVVLMLDGDEAGFRGSDELEERLCDSHQVHVCRLPQGKEPESLTDDELRQCLLPLLPPPSP